MMEEDVFRALNLPWIRELLTFLRWKSAKGERPQLPNFAMRILERVPIDSSQCVFSLPTTVLDWTSLKAVLSCSQLLLRNTKFSSILGELLLKFLVCLRCSLVFLACALTTCS